MLSEHVRDTFVILKEVHIGVIYRIHLMIGSDPLTQCSIGFMTGDKAGQGKTMMLFCAWYCVVIYACVKPCSVMLENVILYEMINDLLCMNPLKAEP